MTKATAITTGGFQLSLAAYDTKPMSTGASVGNSTNEATGQLAVVSFIRTDECERDET